LYFFINEIKRLKGNISTTQGLEDSQGFLRKICREIDNAILDYRREYTNIITILPRMKRNDYVEPIFDDKMILLKLESILTELGKTNFTDNKSFEKFINEKKDSILLDK
jgi:hypothetical protein